MSDVQKAAICSSLHWFRKRNIIANKVNLTKTKKRTSTHLIPGIYFYSFIHAHIYKSKRKAMNRNWSNQKANPALKTKAGNK